MPDYKIRDFNKQKIQTLLALNKMDRYKKKI